MSANGNGGGGLRFECNFVPTDGVAGFRAAFEEAAAKLSPLVKAAFEEAAAKF